MSKLLIPLDKANHIIYGYLIYSAGLLIFPAWLSMLTVIAAAATKELVFDKLLKKGTPDPIDFICTVAGALPALLITILK